MTAAFRGEAWRAVSRGLVWAGVLDSVAGTVDGVPVVSLFGKSAVSRAGFSQSSNLGLSQLAVGNADEFVSLAVKLAQDREQLRRLRATLRNRMIASPLMDARRFAGNVESAYRLIWRIWCRKQASQRATM